MRAGLALPPPLPFLLPLLPLLLLLLLLRLRRRPSPLLRHNPHPAPHTHRDLGQFRFLKRLLLVHGRANYKRVSLVVLYSLYKNCTLVSAMFCFCAYNGWSGTGASRVTE